ncbi:hypothetical protein BS579_01530, partial [Acinetobacter baumannii]
MAHEIRNPLAAIVQ